MKPRKPLILSHFQGKKKRTGIVSIVPFLFGGEDGIRTHVPVKANAFRVIFG